MFALSVARPALARAAIRPTTVARVRATYAVQAPTPSMLPPGVTAEAVSRIASNPDIQKLTQDEEARTAMLQIQKQLVAKNFDTTKPPGMIEMAKLLADPEIRDSMQSLAKSMQRLQINPATLKDLFTPAALTSASSEASSNSQQTASEDVVASERSSLDPHSPELAQQLKPKSTAEDEAHLRATHSEDVVASERSSIDPHSPELAQKIKPSREEHARHTGSEDVVAGERSGVDPLEGKPEKVGGEKKGGMFSWLFNGSK